MTSQETLTQQLVRERQEDLDHQILLEKANESDGELWSATVYYHPGHIILGGDGEWYQSMTMGNIGNDPVVSPGSWIRL
jgi:hypothetical protein